MDGKDEVIPGGFAQVAESLCNGSAGEQALEVRLNETVQRIVVKNGSVTVQTTKGSYRADRVVVTLPLGVLKRGDVVFEPPLSPAKKDAVDKIGFGVLNKVFLKFNNVFWNKTKPFFALVEDDITQRGFLTFWINGYYVAGTPSLIGLLAGDSAVDAEAMTDDVVRGKAAAVLRRLFESNATEPEVNFTMTRWNKDPYAFGAYSYHAVGSNASQRAALGASECPLHFAGEHTDTSYFATVHGAFLSGQRAAKEIEASPLSCKSSASATIIPALLILVLLTAHPF